MKKENSSCNYRKVPKIFLKIPANIKNGRGYNSFKGYIGVRFREWGIGNREWGKFAEKLAFYSLLPIP